MSKRAIVGIDNDGNFLHRLQDKLRHEQLLEDVAFASVEPHGRLPEEIASSCIDTVKKHLEDGLRPELFFVDIVIVEQDGHPEDRSGLLIAERLHDLLPLVPIVGMTRFISAYKLLSEASLSPYLVGLVIKSHLENTDRAGLELILNLAGAKWKQMMEGRPRHSAAQSQAADQGIWQVQEDPRCEYQVQEVGRDTLCTLLDSLFPRAKGTVGYMRPGFSGSHLFRVSVRGHRGKSKKPTEARHSVVKLSSSPGKLKAELHRTMQLRASVEKSYYPEVRSFEPVTVGAWDAIAFSLQLECDTLLERYESGLSRRQLQNLIRRSLVPFLSSLYGDSEYEQAYVWDRFFSVDARATAAALYSIEEFDRTPRKLCPVDHSALGRVKRFLVTAGASEPAIKSYQSQAEIRSIHGDLNPRNILVDNAGSRFVFIDFALHTTDHAVRDIAKLECDLVLLALDGAGLRASYWNRLSSWRQLAKLYSLSAPRGRLTSRDDQVRRMTQVIRELRSCLADLSNSTDWQQYFMAVLHHYLRGLSYRDVTLPKKALCLSLCHAILVELGRAKR